MAYLIGSYNFATPELDTSGSFAFDMPEHEAGDLLIVIVTHRTNSTIAITGSFTERSTQAFTRGNRSAFFQKYISTPLSTATVTGGGSGFAVQVHIWRDADATTPVPQFAQQQETVNTNTSFSPSITTTSAWAAVCHAIAGWDNAGYYITADPTFYFMGRAHEDSAKVVSVYNAVVSAGVVPAHNWYIGGADGGTCYTYSVQNAAGGTKPFLYDSGITSVRRYGHMSTFESTTWVTLGSSITTLATLAVDTAAPSATSDTQSFANSSYAPSTMVTHNTTGTLWQGATHTITSADFSNGILSVTLGVRGINRTGVRGVCFIVFDSSGNWSAFNYPKSKILAELFGYTISVSASSAVYDSSGTVDWADITKVGYCWHGDSTSSSLRAFVVRDLVFCQNGVISGGSADSPASIRMLPSYFNQDQYIDHASLQGKSQTMVRRGVTFGDGTNDVYYSGQTQHFTLPSPDRVDYQVADSALDIEFNPATADSVIDLRAQIYEATSRQTFKFNALTHPDASCYFSGLALIGFDVEMVGVLTVPSVSFIACPSIDGEAAQYSNCSITDSPSAGAAMILRDGGSFTSGEVVKADNVYAFEIPAAGDVDLSGTVFTGHTTDINVTAASGVVNITTTGYTPTYITSGADVNIVSPTYAFTVNSSESGALIEICTNGTQTVLASTTGSTLEYVHSLDTVNYRVVKAGFLPQWFGARTLAGNETVDVELVLDPTYNSSHGLAYTTDVSIASNQLTLNTAANGTDIHSALVDALLTESSLINTPYPIQPNGPTAYAFLDDFEFADTASRNNWKKAGVQYLSSDDAVTAEFINVYTLTASVPAGAQFEYQQVAGSGTTDAINTGAISQLIQSYGDASHGNFDYRDWCKVKAQTNGYREVAVDLLDLNSISLLKPVAYPIATPFTPIAVAVGDPAISITITDHGASPVTWNGLNFSITIEAGASSGEDVLRELNYNLSLDAIYEGSDPFNLPEMVIEVGSDFETIRGVIEGGVGASLKGVRVLRSGDAHPDFTRFQSDDGTYYTVPVTANAVISGLVADTRVYIYNSTAASVAYNDIVSGTSYTESYTDGVEYSDGDILQIRLSNCIGTTAYLPQTLTAVVGSTGWSAIASQSLNTIYNDNAIAGSSITIFAPDYVDDEINIITASNFYGTDFYAFCVYTEYTAQGIAEFFDSVAAIDAANLMLRSSVSLLIDNNTSSEVFQLDNMRIYREDGARPVKNPTTGGGGVDVNWREKVYLAETGVSGLTGPEAAQLALISSVDTKLDQSLLDTGTTIPDLISGISAGSAPTVEEIRAELDSNSTQLALILADTNELQINQTNWTTATGFSTFDPDVNTIDDETWTESLTLIRASLNSATDDEAGNAVIMSNDGSKPRLTYTYVAGQLDRSLVSVDAT